MKRQCIDFLAIVGLVSAIIAAFWWVPQTFFQQDEWYYFGQYLLARQNPSIVLSIFSSMHFLPVSTSWNFTLFHLFGFNTMWYWIVSIALHTISAILAYSLLRIFNIRALPAFLGILFFAINPVSSQTITWLSASVCGGVSLMLFLLALWVWITNKKNRSIFLSVLTSILFLFSLLAKEDMIIGFFLVFILFYIFRKKSKISCRPVVIPFFLWIVLFIVAWLLGAKSGASPIYKPFETIVPYIFSIPHWMENIIITHDSLRNVLLIVLEKYTSYLSFIDDDKVLKFLCFIISVLCLAWYGVIVVIRKIPFKIVFFCIFSVAASMLSYYLSISSVYESRYYYLPVFITGVWIAWYLDQLLDKKYRKIFVVSVIVLTLLTSMYGMADQPRKDLLSFHAQRKQLAYEMKKLVTQTPDSVVYYFENGSSLPFQTGVGQMLLVFQASDDNAFLPYLNNYFLWGVLEQGYQHIGKKGFGYYCDINQLAHDLGKGEFDISIVRSYSYDQRTGIFFDITESVRKTL